MERIPISAEEEQDLFGDEESDKDLEDKQTTILQENSQTVEKIKHKSPESEPLSLQMCLNLPVKQNSRMTNQMALELGFPSINELIAIKKRKRLEHDNGMQDYNCNKISSIGNGNGKETNNFCMLIEESTPESTF